MTKLLEQALRKVRQLPAEGQDEVARTMLAMADEDRAPEPIDPLHLADVLKGLAEARRGEFAPDEEIEAAFRRFGE